MPKLLPSFEELQNKLADPAPSWRWIVLMPTITANGAITANAPALTGSNRQDASDQLQRAQLPAFQVLNASFPFMNLDTDQRFYAGIREPFVRFKATSEFNVTFYVDHKYSAMKYIDNWQKLIVNEKGQYSPRNRYAADFDAYFYDTIDEDYRLKLVVRQAFPSSPSPISMQYASGDLIDFSTSFSASWVDMYFNS